MQPQSNMAQGTQFPMRELEQIETAIDAARSWLATLQGRKDALTAELDRITKPVQRHDAKSKVIGPGVEYRGTMYGQSNYIDIHITLLRKLWTDFPEQRESMAMAVGLCGNTRAYVATTREALFRGQSQSFAERHSRALVDGWHADTNLNRERMRRILPAAVRAAGLKWRKDVRVYWHATRAG